MGALTERTAKGLAVAALVVVSALLAASPSPASSDVPATNDESDGGGQAQPGAGPGAFAGLPFQNLVLLIVPNGVITIKRDSRTFSVPLRNGNPFPISATADVTVTAGLAVIRLAASDVAVPAISTRWLVVSTGVEAMRSLRASGKLPIAIRLIVADPANEQATVTGHYLLRAPPQAAKKRDRKGEHAR